MEESQEEKKKVLPFFFFFCSARASSLMETTFMVPIKITSAYIIVSLFFLSRIILIYMVIMTYILLRNLSPVGALAQIKEARKSIGKYFQKSFHLQVNK